MMIYPPIDKLIDKLGNRYKLVCIVAKRAKEIQKNMPEMLLNSELKEISIAADEVYKDKVVIVEE
ncbi:MAG: DNA-directed RNA polymerase subunit omega [Clostridia bacterium]|nr:DNA-directed RNA polymerase subunit omega [Clostridia bacterium]